MKYILIAALTILSLNLGMGQSRQRADQLKPLLKKGELPLTLKERRVIMDFEIPLTKGYLKGKLNVDSKFSRISVRGKDQDFVAVEVVDLSTLNEQYASLDSARWLKTQPKITYTENNNEVTISDISNAPTGLLISISVPNKFAAKLETGHENIFVFDLVGEIEADSKEGNITLTRIDGSIIASSIDGNINAYYKDVSPLYPNALSSIRGDVKLLIPPDASVNVSLSSVMGKVYSDFKLRTHNKNNTTKERKIKTIALGMREASIGINTYSGNINIYNTAKQ